MKKIHILLFALLFLGACAEDELNPKSIFDQKVERSDFDQWLLKNYVETYNVELKYRLEDKESQMQYNLTPADYNKSIAMAKLAKFLWFESYEELLGKTFIRAYSPRIIHLVGSSAYNPNSGSRVVGTAEGGLKVTLYDVNTLNMNDLDINELNKTFFHTMHHEFAHILHQTKEYPVEFNLISAEKYTSSDWINLSDADALKIGFVTRYGSSETQEDFVELISIYVTSSATQWNNRMAVAGSTGKPIIDKKMGIVRNYLKTSWDIDIDKLRDIILRRSSEVSTIDLTTLK
ncbi:MAG: putative zinc-binding metallopeptidase [Bacteroidia bacterium]|nr:putative zinc-binding metallopeptidase [Bacteroidia bacterium]